MNYISDLMKQWLYIERNNWYNTPKREVTIMHLFLTSSNLTLNGQYINEENDFRSLLFDVLPRHIRCLYIASDPTDITHNDEWGNYQKKALMNSHFLVDSFTILDDRK